MSNNSLVFWAGIGADGATAPVEIHEHATILKAAAVVMAIDPNTVLSVFVEARVGDRWITIAAIRPPDTTGVATTVVADLRAATGGNARQARLRWQISGGMVGEALLVASVV